MSEILNKSALAIQAHMRAQGCDCLFLDDEKYMEGIAAVAIASLREPTEEMLAAVYGNHGETNGSDSAARETWQAMTDAALR